MLLTRGTVLSTAPREKPLLSCPCPSSLCACVYDTRAHRRRSVCKNPATGAKAPAVDSAGRAGLKDRKVPGCGRLHAQLTSSLLVHSAPPALCNRHHLQQLTSSFLLHSAPGNGSTAINSSLQEDGL